MTATAHSHSHLTGDALDESVGVIGSGIAGLVTAHTLVQDGFKHVELLTRDKTAGGVWCEERVYPGLHINRHLFYFFLASSPSVHGEFRFSALAMREPEGHTKTGGRLSGEDVRQYMDDFAKTFLAGNIRFETNILNIRRGGGGTGWAVLVHDLKTSTEKTLYYSRIVVCTGGCSIPRYPESLTLAAAKAAQFSGPVLHSMYFRSRIDDLLSCTSPDDPHAAHVIVVGGGKSAADSAAFLAREGRPVTMIFDTTDSFVASPTPLPPAIRKSRFLSVMSGHKELRSRIERFLHTTWLGGIIVYYFWQILTSFSFYVLGVPRDSPLRRAHDLFYNARTNDEGIPREGSFHSLANAGKINLISPARVARFGDDGHSVVLEDGRTLRAAAVILATGYGSSWRPIFDDETMEELGLGRQPPRESSVSLNERWDYPSLDSLPSVPGDAPWTAMVYRGLVPAKSILKRDFAVNGATFTAHHAYVSEVSAHWISAYFRRDSLRLPKTVEEARASAEVDAAWVRRRYPHVLNWFGESNTTAVWFWTWPQFVDDLLEDMGVPSMRSGGNWLTWLFKAVDLDEIIDLKAERDAKRRG
ncbi:FAD/NAD-P-binding domain-containing protein [Multifurca ochricompacta]|uniref:FAD/NAD-P-binding domain-containing protein n=1 Tax=Multifurca ochricompacta TaxID=376703 RepID=A0AAD4M5H1_9AGAM|nr:FAD/NAD-P-binding domain-containing protein [Multifurca ochricompacta]